MYEADEPRRAADESQPSRPSGAEQMAPPKSNLYNKLEQIGEEAESGATKIGSLQRHFDYWFSIFDLIWLKPSEITQKAAYEFSRVASETPSDPMVYWKTAEEYLWGPSSETVRNAAHLMWEAAGHQPEQALNYWLAGQKYIGSLVAVARKVTGLTIISDPASLGALIDAFSPAAYLRRVEQLAERMAEDAELPAAVFPHDFWLAAERYILVLIASVAYSANSHLEAVNKLTATFRGFSPEQYLQAIREAAYDIWKSTGAQPGKSLHFWLEAERKYLQDIADGRTPPLGPNSPPG
jgi:DUF2934 family protein